MGSYGFAFNSNIYLVSNYWIHKALIKNNKSKKFLALLTNLFGTGVTTRPAKDLWTTFRPDRCSGSRVMNFQSFHQIFQCFSFVVFFILHITSWKVKWVSLFYSLYIYKKKYFVYKQKPINIVSCEVFSHKCLIVNNLKLSDFCLTALSFIKEVN